MGDMGDMYNDWKELKKESKQKNEEKNLNIINGWLAENENRYLLVAFRSTSILFRDPAKPKADFFPTTNRWRANQRTFSGNATKFLEWYKQQ